jgi:hypothetical protein
VGESVPKVGTPDLKNLVVTLLPMILKIPALLSLKILIVKVLLAQLVASSGARPLVVISIGVMLHSLWMMGLSFSLYQWGRFFCLAVVIKMLIHI